MKERLVGAAVLVGIAVWLIPWVLDGPGARLETSGSSLKLPVAEEPMPMRTQTLRLRDAPEPAAAGPSAGVQAPAADAAAPPVEPRAEAEPAGAAQTRAAAEPAVAAQTRAAAVQPGAAPARADGVPPEPAAAPARAGTPPAAPAATAARVEPETAAPAASAAPPARAAASKQAPDAPAVGGDWTVQLGSFGDEANARRLAQRSATFGYKADVTSHRSGDRTLYRVRVGPSRSHAEAAATASALKAHGVDAAVVSAR